MAQPKGVTAFCSFPHPLKIPHGVAMKGKATRRVRELIEELEAEGEL